MFEKIGGAWNALKAGESVVDAVRLKQTQLFANSVGALLIALVALAKSFGVDLPLDDDQLTQLGAAAGVLFGLFNHYATAASTNKIDGLGRATPAADGGDGGSQDVPGMASRRGPDPQQRPTARAIAITEPVRTVPAPDAGSGNQPQDFTGDSSRG